MAFAATPPVNPDEPNPPGTLCKYYKAPADFLFKLPDHVSLSWALWSSIDGRRARCKLANLKFGENVVVFGLAPLGC